MNKINILVQSHSSDIICEYSSYIVPSVGDIFYSLDNNKYKGLGLIVITRHFSNIKPNNVVLHVKEL